MAKENSNSENTENTVQTLPGGITQVQLDKWKKDPDIGKVFQIKVDRKDNTKAYCYVKKPSRTILAAAMKFHTSDPVKMNEILLTNCWLGGDEEIKTDDAMFMAAASEVGELIEIRTAEIKEV